MRKAQRNSQKLLNNLDKIQSWLFSVIIFPFCHQKLGESAFIVEIYYSNFNIDHFQQNPIILKINAGRFIDSYCIRSNNQLLYVTRQ